MLALPWVISYKLSKAAKCLAFPFGLWGKHGRLAMVTEDVATVEDAEKKVGG